MGLRYDASCICHSGVVRLSNEDNLLFFGQILPQDHYPDVFTAEKQGVLSEPVFLAVFDGISGEAFGEKASRSAADALGSLRKKRLLEKEYRYLEYALGQMNDAVYRCACQLQAERVGTTAVGIYLNGSRTQLFNAGDSPAFLLRDGVLTQQSVEDTNREYLLRQGKTTEKPRLIQHLGIDPSSMRLEPHILPYCPVSGDLLLLCSDGLTDMVDQDTITQILYSKDSAAVKAQKLADTAIAQGGKDNITVLICAFTEE